MTEPHDLTALEQAAAIRSGEISSVELTEHYLRRCESLTDAVGAFVTITAELARSQAEAADRAIRSHRVNYAADSEGTELSPLFGVVCPVKDLVFVAGVRCRMGSAAVDLVPESDDNVVAAMRRAGLVFTGKSNTPEFGLPCYTEPDVAPPARTPWDLSRSAGGSSGGAAAAVAAGLAPIAHGNDGGGSIRIPASVTGLVGIKPSRGRISNGPATDLIGDLVTHGTLARTVADAAALLDVMATPFAGDPYHALGPVRGSFLAAARREPGRLKIGYYLDPGMLEIKPGTEVVAAIEHAAALLTDLGHDLAIVRAPLDPSILPRFRSVWAVLASQVPLKPELESQLRPLTRHLRAGGSQVSGLELAEAVSAMRAASRLAVSATSQFDAVLAPVLTTPPVGVGALRDDADPAADFAAQLRFNPYCAPYNVTGQPSITVPINWTEDGLPIGIQLVGRPNDEETIISLAASLEQAEPWIHRWPSMW